MASHIVSFQDSLCSCLDVIDARYSGNAKQILLRERDESINANTNNNNLDMIGETPNPDDEETYRHNKGVSPDPMNQTSSIKLINQFIAEEESKRHHHQEQPSSSRQDAEDADYASKQETSMTMPNLAREPRHFIKMQKTVHARGEQYHEDWIEKRINELQ